MAIATAVQRGHFVYLYDEKNRQTTIIPAGSGPNEGLTGYTAASVSIRRGRSFISTMRAVGKRGWCPRVSGVLKVTSLPSVSSQAWKNRFGKPGRDLLAKQGLIGHIRNSRIANRAAGWNSNLRICWCC